MKSPDTIADRGGSTSNSRSTCSASCRSPLRSTRAGVLPREPDRERQRREAEHRARRAGRRLRQQPRDGTQCLLASGRGEQPQAEQRRDHEHRHVRHGVADREGGHAGGAAGHEQRVARPPQQQPDGADRREREPGPGQVAGEDPLPEQRRLRGRERAPVVAEEPILELPPEHDPRQLVERRRARLDVGLRIARAHENQRVRQEAERQDRRGRHEGAGAQHEVPIDEQRLEREPRREGQDRGVVAEPGGEAAERGVEVRRAAASGST